MATIQYCDYDIKGTLAVAGVSTFSDEIELDQTNNFINPSSDNNKTLFVGVAFGTQWSSISMAATSFLVTNGGFGAPAFSVSGNNIATAGDLTVSGGDITLGGTGRIQGVDTVSASTDAANKAYVDAHGGGLGPFLPLAGGTMTGNTDFLDNVKLIFGNSDDLNIFHDSANTYLENKVGDLIFRQEANDKDIIFKCDNGSGGDEAYLTLDGSNERIVVKKEMAFLDNVKLKLGTGPAAGAEDLQIYHNGTNSNIENFNGTLQIIQNLNDGDISFRSDDGSGGTAEYFRLDGGQEKTLFSKNTEHQDNVKAQFGNSGDFNVFHDGTNSYLENDTGDLYIRNNFQDRDIILQSDDGGGGIATYIQIDGSQTNVNFQKDAIFTDGIKALFGGSGDLQIYHDGSNSRIKDTGTGALILNSNLVAIQNAAATETMAKFFETGSVDLYYNDSKKFETTSTGVTCTDISLTNNQFQVKNQSGARYTSSGDPDTGLGEFDNANGVSLVSKGNKQITVKENNIKFDPYTATAVGTGSPAGALNPNQSNQALTADTLAQLCVDPDGNVVRGEQEGTWTFTRAQLNGTLGLTLISAPGANKAIIVTESDWMVKYSATGTVSGNQSFDIRQANNVFAAANISTLPGARINEIINSAQGTPTNPSFGFCARDIPLTTRTYKTNVATTLNKKTNDQLPAGVISISIKLKYRLFNGDTF